MEIKVDSRYWKEEFGFLVYRGPNNIPIDLPDGVKDCSYMFAGMQFRVGATLRNFDTSRVQSIYGMFENCIIPPGFSFGRKFTGESLRDMRYFLFGAYINSGVDMSFLNGLKAPLADCNALKYTQSFCRKKALFSWKQKDRGILNLTLADREIPLRSVTGSGGKVEEFALLGDTFEQKGVLINIAYGDKLELDQKLKYLLQDDDVAYSKYCNLRYEKVERASAWWQEGTN